MQPRSITPRSGPLAARLTIAPSKSVTHRALIAGALGLGTTRVRNPLDADDTRITLNALAAMGFAVSGDGAVWSIEGLGGRVPGGGSIGLKEAKKQKGKTARVTVRLPVPPRLEIRGDEKLLVTSFRAGENAMIDTNNELVDFLRGEFRKDTALDVLDIDPPPAIPEQTIPDLLANREFWQYLGRNFDSEIIVSGVVNYTRDDLSGYQQVDVISPSTGQKVRQSRFVEQEEFRYVVDLFFMDGPTGTLLFRDRLQRAVVFQGKSNDPVSAFFAMSESVAADVLAVVTPRIREDSRVIFKR
ncbi:hypothetical protein N9971_00925 [bacterium]|nr:hypothetical protein [bacterium]